MCARAPRRQVHGLDLLRFLAALLVVGYHLAFKAWATPGEPLGRLLGAAPALPPWWPATWFGWIGVQLFFVLSGLVIAWSSQGAAPFGFFRSRLLRLWPGMLIAASVAALIALGLGLHPAPTAGVLWIRSILFFPVGPWIAGQIWTLPIELSFYALVFLLLRFGRLDLMGFVAFVLAGLAAVYWLVRSVGFEDPFPRAAELLLLPHGCYFALGLLIWLVDRSGLSPLRAGAIAVCLGAAYLQIQATAAQEDPGYALGRAAIVPFAAWLAMVTGLAASLRWRGVAAPRIAAAIRTIGLSTYPIYLLHWHVGGAVMVAAFRSGAGAAASTALGVAASIVAGVVAVRLEPLIRKPLGAAADRLGERRGPVEIIFGPIHPRRDEPRP